MREFEVANPREQGPVRGKSFHEWVSPDGSAWTRFYRAEAGYLLRFPELADFEVALDGHGVRCWPAPGATEGTLQHLYLNQVLPLALSQQGNLVFHASAIELDGAAIAFMGISGRGKSTLAASFATNGFAFLTDDGLIVENVGADDRVLPSHPSIRLWSDSCQALIGQGAQTAAPAQFSSKARFLAGKDIAFCAQSRPLCRVYFLGPGMARSTTIEPVNPANALIELVRHSFLLDIEERDVLASHFEALSRMVRRPVHYRLDYPRNFDDLAEVRRVIVEHVRSGSDQHPRCHGKLRT